MSSHRSFPGTLGIEPTSLLVSAAEEVAAAAAGESVPRMMSFSKFCCLSGSSCTANRRHYLSTVETGTEVRSNPSAGRAVRGEPGNLLHCSATSSPIRVWWGSGVNAMKFLLGVLEAMIRSCWYKFPRGTSGTFAERSTWMRGIASVTYYSAGELSDRHHVYS